MTPSACTPAPMACGLSKSERIVSRSLVDKMFGGGSSRSMSAYPLRLVYMKMEQRDGAQAQILVSVPKKHFKHAVDRNRVKRQVREAYRHNKHVLLDVMKDREGEVVALAFIWQARVMITTGEVAEKMNVLLNRVAEKIKRDGQDNGQD